MQKPTVELTAETKSILAMYPMLQNVWRDNVEPPTFPSQIPHETCYYQGDSFTPVLRFVNGELVEHHPSEEGPYTLLVVCDDIPASLSIGSQVIFDYTDQIDLPEFSMTAHENTLATLEAQLNQALTQQVGV